MQRKGKTPMATNLYDREESILFDPKNPATLYGWHVSGTSVDTHVSGFHSKVIKNQYVTAVSASLRKSRTYKNTNPNEIAAFAFGVFCGEDSDLLMEFLLRALGGNKDIEIGDFYDERLEPLAKKFNERDDEARLAELKRAQHRLRQATRMLKKCVHCRKLENPAKAHLDRNKDWICDGCWDERMR